MKSETLPVCLQFSQTAHPPTVVRARGGFRREEKQWAQQLLLYNGTKFKL